MSEKKKNLSDSQDYILPKLSHCRVGIVVSRWNNQVTGSMCDAAIQILKNCEIKDENILTHWVPGSYELPMAAQFMLESCDVDAVICIGTVIQGETRHFEFICQSVAQQIATVGLKHNIPVIFGVLTTDTMQQALDRSGGIHGNKGVEAAMAAVQMIELKQNLSTL